MEKARAMGVTLVINNRPDGEDAGQPTSVEVEEWARAAGLDYLWLPIRGRPAPQDVEHMAAAMKSDANILAFCRSGMRSAAAWAMAEALNTPGSHEDIRRTALEAGYDLSGLPL